MLPYNDEPVGQPARDFFSFGTVLFTHSPGDPHQGECDLNLARRHAAEELVTEPCAVASQIPTGGMHLRVQIGAT
jgi:hypothetical protein